MKVTKRDGASVDMKFDKVTTRISKLTSGLSPVISADKVAQKVFSSMYDGIHTKEIDTLSAEIAVGMITEDPDYEVLATRIVTSNLHKTCPSLFTLAMEQLYQNEILSNGVWTVIVRNEELLNDMIVPEYDNDFGFFGLKTLEKGYLQKVKGVIVETPQYMFLRVALGIHGSDIDRVRQTYDYMSQRYFTHATPTLFNAGTPRPQMSSCFLVGMKDDSIDGIYDTLKECAQISKWAGGIGLHLHNVRANKSRIKGTNGVSDGIIPMLRVFNSTARYVNQAGKRKGSIAVYLEPWHADIMEFLELRLNQGDEEARARDLFTALWIPDLFMKRVQDGGDWSLFSPDEAPGLSDCYGEEFEELYHRYEKEGRARVTLPASKIWMAILKSQTETGTPYMLYKDACNKKSNQKNLGVIKSSNLCVAPDTMVLTDRGYTRIADMENQIVSVWNGEEFSRTIVVKTGVDQELIKVKTSAGFELECTPYHKFYIETSTRPSDKSKPVKVDAQDLEPGMRIIRYSLPVMNQFTDTMKYPYTHGFFCADGTYQNANSKSKKCNYKKKGGTDFCGRHQNCLKLYDDVDTCCAETYTRRPIIYLYGDKKKLIRDIEWVYMNGSDDRLTLVLPCDTDEKYFVPINYSLDTRLRWLEGYCDGDGCILMNNGIKNIQFASINLEFITNISYMLQTLGIATKISVANHERSVKLPGGTYKCKKIYRTNIDANGILKLIDLGFSPKRLDISNTRKPHHITNAFITITEVVYEGKRSDTFCFNEPKKHAGVFNGLLTGQCTEITEVSNPEETAVCNLASLALPQFVTNGCFGYTKLYEVVRIVTRNLNKVIDNNYYPTETARRSNMRHRPIGLGVQGLADVFILMGLPFDHPVAKQVNRTIFETIYFAALSESCLMAAEECPYETFHGSPASKGLLQFDLWEGENKHSGLWDWDRLKKDISLHGLRNSLLVAPMPTASTSQILGNNECIEPYTTNIYLRRTLAGEFVVVNKHLVRKLKELGMWSKEMKDLMVAAGGSIQNIKEIPNDVKEIFRTVWEISQKSIITMAAERGRYIDQSQSLNLFMENPTVPKLSSMHMYAWKTGLKTGMYYLRTKAKSKAIQFTLEPCTTCSA